MLRRFGWFVCRGTGCQPVSARATGWQPVPRRDRRAKAAKESPHSKRATTGGRGAMRRTLGLVLVLALAAGAAQAQPNKGREPLVRGKTAAAWAKALESKQAVDRLQAINALRDAGPEARKAAPALIAIFRDKDATFLH